MRWARYTNNFFFVSFAVTLSLLISPYAPCFDLSLKSTCSPFLFYNGKSHLCYHVDRLPVNSRWIPLFSIVTPIIQANKINYVMRFHRAFVTKYTNETSPNQAKENMILSHKRKILKSIYHVYTSYDVVKIRIDQKNLSLVLKGQNSQSPS